MKKLELDDGIWLGYEGIPKEEAIAYFNLYYKNLLSGIEWVCVWLDDDVHVKVAYMLNEHVEFERIRRINGYFINDIKRWNDGENAQ